MDPIVASIVRYRRLIFVCAVLIGALYAAFKKYSGDRVILWEAIGVSVFLIGIVVWGVFGFSEPTTWVFAAFGVAAVFCGLLAMYFALAQWVRRRSRRL